MRYREAARSKPLPVLRGVPQGSVFGLLLATITLYACIQTAQVMLRVWSCWYAWYCTGVDLYLYVVLRRIISAQHVFEAVLYGVNYNK